ncbi:MAG TPA: hypothetical protein VFA48_06210 [Gammaproteobacteria bacterium]|nr:hypothetical protein [Gammaproteobacteria bacterium]
MKMKEIVRFVDSANTAELLRKREAVQELIDMGGLDEDTRADARRVLRLINEELLARAEVEELRASRR